MAKKKKTEEADMPNLETILFNCREYLRSNASLNDKRDLLLTLVFLRFIGANSSFSPQPSSMPLSMMP